MILSPREQKKLEKELEQQHRWIPPRSKGSSLCMLVGVYPHSTTPQKGTGIYNKSSGISSTVPLSSSSFSFIHKAIFISVTRFAYSTLICFSPALGQGSLQLPIIKFNPSPMSSTACLPSYSPLFDQQQLIGWTDTQCEHWRTVRVRESRTHWAWRRRRRKRLYNLLIFSVWLCYPYPHIYYWYKTPHNSVEAYPVSNGSGWEVSNGMSGWSLR